MQILLRGLSSLGGAAYKVDMHVLTLIGAPGTSALTDSMVEGLGRQLAGAGADCGRPVWLAPGEACDLSFEGVAPERATQVAEVALGAAPIDFFTQAQEGRRKTILLADMESTIIAEEMLDELAEAAQLGPRIAEITARVMAGELDFEASLTERVSLLAGLPASLLDQLGSAMTLNPGALTLVRTLSANGCYCALVSGGFDIFTERVRARCGFDESRANRLIVEDGEISGRVAKPILGRQEKRQALDHISTSRGLTAQDVCAVGDGANDLDMLEAAGLGVAYRAKPLLRRRMRPLIDHGDLTAILYLQGYHRRDFITADCGTMGQ